MKLIGQASGTDTSTKVREKQLLTHQGQAAAFFYSEAPHILLAVRESLFTLPDVNIFILYKDLPFIHIAHAM